MYNDDPNFVMYGLDRYDSPSIILNDFIDDTGCTFPFLMNAYDVGVLYDNAMKFWVIDADGFVTYESGTHQQNIAAQQAAIEAALMTLDVDDPAPAETPREFALLNAYPNPFNNSVTVSLELPANEAVRVSVVDLLGREVALLNDAPLTAGAHRLSWSPDNLPSGLYLLRVQGEAATFTRKLMYLK